MSEKPTFDDLKKIVSGISSNDEVAVYPDQDGWARLAERVRFEKALREAIWAELEVSIKFEKLLADLTTLFVNIPANEVDDTIHRALRNVGEAIDIDRCTFMEFSPKLGQIYVTHSWVRKGLKTIAEIFPGDYLTTVRIPWSIEQMSREKIFIFTDVDTLPKEAERDKKTFRKLGVKSGMIIPYFVDNSFLFAFSFGSISPNRVWPEGLRQRLMILGEVFSNAILRKQADIERSRAFAEIKELKDRLQKEAILLREEIKVIQKHADIVGESEAIKKVLRQVEQVAPTNSTVLILGETGTGKELVARAIHRLSPRKDQAMVTVNCAAFPGTLVEAELFGREKGAYTGSISKQVGRFEIADGSTIFLDEIGESPLDFQVKLLRVLQEGKFERLGGSKTIRVDVRVIAATNRSLEDAIRAGNFREDLFYRLNVFPIHVPPLRARIEDIVPLTWAFVKEFSDAMGKRVDTIPQRTLEAMRRYAWPGNIRELRNLVERAVIMSKDHTLALELPESSRLEPTGDLTIEDLDRRHIRSVLDKTNWRVRGRNGAAERLGLNPSTLYARMKKLGITRPA